jgi:hypothetical protein
MGKLVCPCSSTDGTGKLLFAHAAHEFRTVMKTGRRT